MRCLARTLCRTPSFGIFRCSASPSAESIRHGKTRTPKDYFDVDFESVWNVVTRDLVPLEAVMHSIQARLDEIG